jgi:predicted permease
MKVVLRRVVAGLKALVAPSRLNSELDEELQAYLDASIEAKVAGGMSRDRATRRARAELGSTAAVKEYTRSIGWEASVGALWQDARYALRGLRKHRGFSATVIVTLGLGIGLNVSLFSIFNTLALRPWDVRDPGTVVVPFARPVGNRTARNALPLAEFQYLKEQSRTLAGLIAWEPGAARLYGENGSELTHVQLLGVSAGFFDVLGVDMAQGRGILASDDQRGAPNPVAVISHGLWRNLFAGDASIVGRIIRIGVARTAVTIVGVSRRGFAGIVPEADDGAGIAVYVPQSLIDQVDSPPGEQDSVKRLVGVAGRLAPGISRQASETELNVLDRQFRTSVSLDGNGLVLTGTRAIGQPGEIDGTAIFAGFGAALLLVLLLACANVGNLQLARTLARRREIAVRLSLGASRGRVIRQLLTEAVCLSLAASMIGFGLAWILPRLILSLLDEEINVSPDATVLTFAVVLGLTSTMLFALAPAVQATRARQALILHSRSGIDRHGRRLRSLLLASQVALSMTLLIGAGLLTRGLAHVRSADLGFDAHGTTYAQLTLPLEGPRSERVAVFHRVDAALRGSDLWPVGQAGLPPLSESPFIARVRRSDETEEWNRLTFARPLSAASFEILGLSFVAGGPASENPDAKQAVINQTLAGMLFGAEAAVGRSVLADEEPYTVSGVVRDSYFTTPGEVAPLFHRAPTPSSTWFLLFKSHRPDTARQLRTLLAGIDSRLQVRIAPVAANIEAVIEERRTAASLAWAIGALGLALATIGVFGVFAYGVEERRREIGIRLALGARSHDIVRTMFAVTRWSVGGGLAAGLLLSVSGGFVLRSYLFGLTPLDPAAYLMASLPLCLAGALATIVPARRALRVDPAVTLKCE